MRKLGLAAPWPMVAALWWACVDASRSRDIVWRWLSMGFLAGALSEGVTYRALRGSESPVASLVSAMNILIPGFMLIVSTRE